MFSSRYNLLFIFWGGYSHLISHRRDRFRKCEQVRTGVIVDLINLQVAVYFQISNRATILEPLRAFELEKFTDNLLA